MKFLRAITHSGLSPNDRYQKKRGIIITNYLSLILCAAVMVNFTVRNTVYHEVANAPGFEYLFIGIILFALPIPLNRFLFTTASRLFLCVNTAAFLWILFLSHISKFDVVQTSLYDTFRLFLITVSIIPYLIFDRSKLFTLFLGILPTLISIVFFEQVLGWFGVAHHQRGIPGDDYQLMQMRTIIAYVVISAGCYTFQTIIIQNDEFNQQLLTELEDQAEEIRAQNEELVSSHNQLNKINQHLEALVDAKTASIKKQNEKLMNYAYTNAHHLRGPVARLLGLIQLSRMKTDLSHPWVFTHVEQEALKIDEIIKRIGNDLNEDDTIGD